MSDFTTLGYKIFKIPYLTSKRLIEFFDDKYQRPFDKDDCVDGYEKSEMTKDTVDALNREHVYYGPPNNIAIGSFRNYMMLIYDSVRMELGYSWKVGNVRAWKTHPASNFGPTGWHRDMLPAAAIKMMLYLQPMNLENGTVELVDRQGQPHLLKTDFPACVLFDNNALEHRGRSGQRDRLAIEVLTLPSTTDRIDYVYAGQNARMPHDLQIS